MKLTGCIRLLVRVCYYAIWVGSTHHSGSLSLASFEGVLGHAGGPMCKEPQVDTLAEDGIPGDTQQELEALSSTTGIPPIAWVRLEADPCPVKPQMTL